MNISIESLSEEKCTLDIVKVGSEHCSPKKGVVDRVRPNYSLHFVLFGKGTLIADDKTYTVNRGEAFLLYEGEHYNYYPDPRDPWSYMWVEVKGKNLDKIFSFCGFRKDNCCMYLNEFDGYVSLMQELLAAFDASETQKLKGAAYFLLLLSRFIERENEKQHFSKDIRKKRMLRDILIYINNNFYMDLSNETLARESGISVRTLTSLFMEVLNMTPVQYITSYRISIACERFQTTEMNVGEVSRWAGYEDEKYFSRIFKKEKGMTPQEYRKNQQKEDPFGWLKDRNIDFR
ncbi:MAG: hypothetical protein DBY05_05610 [Clostridiales bacterium]|jgi:transcriptional regulator, AraC family|nr:MAG: hypothetical protein DBY05_05610 [Clostridiales bacterium]